MNRAFFFPFCNLSIQVHGHRKTNVILPLRKLNNFFEFLFYVNIPKYHAFYKSLWHEIL